MMRHSIYLTFAISWIMFILNHYVEYKNALTLIRTKWYHHESTKQPTFLSLSLSLSQREKRPCLIIYNFVWLDTINLHFIAFILSYTFVFKGPIFHIFNVVLSFFWRKPIHKRLYLWKYVTIYQNYH